MKDEWRFVSLQNGKQFVTTTGVRTKQELCVDNLGIQLKVIICAVFSLDINYYNSSCIMMDFNF